MAPHYNPSRALLGLAKSFRRLDVSDPLTQVFVPRLQRSFASQTEMPAVELAGQIATETKVDLLPPSSTSSIFPSQLHTTIYSFPELEPQSYALYNPQLLGLPLRRDLLHRAVIYEADGSRQGTASTKWRGDVHGSNRKIQQQKGTGRARVGDKKSPIRRGGGVAFGPHPRDFSTDLPRKIYDLAWRTALSYRYRKGELIITDGPMRIPPLTGGRLLENIFLLNNWGQGYGRSLLVTATDSAADSKSNWTRLQTGMKDLGQHGVIKDLLEVDVKDLLEMGRIVIEKRALDCLLMSHVSDLGREVTTEGAKFFNWNAIVHAEGPLTRDVLYRKAAKAVSM